MPPRPVIASRPELKVCSKCKLELPFDMFYKNRTETGGYNTQCKGCFRETQAVSKAKRKSNPIAPRMVGNKVCSQCIIEKPIIEFYPCYTAVDGREYRCKSCCKTNTADWLARTDLQILSAVKQRWYEQNQEISIWRAKQYRIEHPEWAREANTRGSRKRRATKLSAPLNDLTTGEWKLLLDTFEHSCAYCGDSESKLTMDHVVPLSKGGSHTFTNIVPACKSCNSRKSATSANSFLRKLHTRPYIPSNTRLDVLKSSQVPALSEYEQFNPSI